MIEQQGGICMEGQAGDPLAPPRHWLYIKQKHSNRVSLNLSRQKIGMQFKFQIWPSWDLANSQPDLQSKIRPQRDLIYRRR